MRFVSLFFRWIYTVVVVNWPERKLTKCTSVHCQRWTKNIIVYKWHNPSKQISSIAKLQNVSWEYKSKIFHDQTCSNFLLQHTIYAYTRNNSIILSFINISKWNQTQCISGFFKHANQLATYLSFNLIVCNLVQLLTTCFRSKLMVMACSFKIVLKKNSMPHHTACILSDLLILDRFSWNFFTQKWLFL